MRLVLSYLLWPLIFAAACFSSYLGMQTATPVLWFNCGYLALVFVLIALERAMPHERAWLSNDGQILPDIAHTLLNKSAVQILIVAVAIMGTTEAIHPSAASWWPSGWPLVFQIVLGLVIAEFGLYWAHRLGHEVPILWRFHAVHHSVTRLWVVNTGRFHFVDTIKAALFGLGPALLIGMPDNVIVWNTAITAYVGLLTHCNIEMRFGWLNHVFNTPALHRWHHSKVLEEGDRNYGENLMIWDLVFGTYFNADRRPPVHIGIRDTMPASFAGQLAYPFRRQPAPREPAEIYAAE